MGPILPFLTGRCVDLVLTRNSPTGRQIFCALATIEDGRTPRTRRMAPPCLRRSMARLSQTREFSTPCCRAALERLRNQARHLSQHVSRASHLPAIASVCTESHVFLFTTLLLSVSRRMPCFPLWCGTLVSRVS